MTAFPLLSELDDFAVDHQSPFFKFAENVYCFWTIEPAPIAGVEPHLCAVLNRQRSTSVSFDFIEPALPMWQHRCARAEHGRNKTRLNRMIPLHRFALLMPSPADTEPELEPFPIPCRYLNNS